MNLDSQLTKGFGIDRCEQVCADVYIPGNNITGNSSSKGYYQKECHQECEKEWSNPKDSYYMQSINESHIIQIPTIDYTDENGTAYYLYETTIQTVEICET